MKNLIKKSSLSLLAVAFVLITIIPRSATAAEYAYKKTTKVSGGDYNSSGEIRIPVSFCEYVLADDAAVEGQLTAIINSDYTANVGGTLFIPKAHYPLIEGDSFAENGAVISYSKNILTETFIEKGNRINGEIQTITLEITPDMKTVGNVHYSFKKYSFMVPTLLSGMDCNFTSL